MTIVPNSLEAVIPDRYSYFVICVPVLPCRAARQFESEVMMAFLPPPSKKFNAASTFGFILPAWNSPALR